MFKYRMRRDLVRSVLIMQLSLCLSCWLLCVWFDLTSTHQVTLLHLTSTHRVKHIQSSAQTDSTSGRPGQLHSALGWTLGCLVLQVGQPQPAWVRSSQMATWVSHRVLRRCVREWMCACRCISALVWYVLRLLALLQKIFVEAGKITFIEVAAIPVHTSRSYKYCLQGRLTCLLLEIHFQGRVTSSPPLQMDPSLKMDFQRRLTL